MVRQQIEPLRLASQPQRLARKTQRLVLGIVWAMVPFLLLQGYLRYGELRPSSIIAVALVLILTGIMAAFRPAQVARSLPQPTLLVDASGLRIEGGIYELTAIPWSEIVALRPLVILGIDMVHIVLRDPQKLKQSLGFYWYNNRWPGGIALPIVAFGPAKEVVTRLNTYRSEHGL
jgi:uncharacterized protein YjeT (DUF2065 family)